MPTTDERLSALEANEKNIFHQLDEIKQEQKDQRQLIVVVEQIASKTNVISGKVTEVNETVVQINDRVTNLEQEPARAYKKYKETIFTSIITLIIGAVVGGLLALLLK